MKRNKLLLLLMLSLLLVFAAACGSNDENGDSETPDEGQETSEGNEGNAGEEIDKSDWPSSMQMVSGSTGGGYYRAGATIGSLIESELGIAVSSVPTTGSAENINLIDSGEAQLGIISSNTVYPAYYGIIHYEGDQKQNHRLVSFLFPNKSVWYTLEDSGIETFKDLTGKRVYVGVAPATWDILSKPILEAHGMDYDAIEPVYAGFGESATQVGDGLIDAAIGNYTIPAIVELANTKDLHFIKYDDAAIDALGEEYPWFQRVTTPAGHMPGIDEDYDSVDLGGPFLVANKDLPDSLVQEITRVFVENIDQLARDNNDFKIIAEDPESMAVLLKETPYHPGAERYWKDIGYME